MSARSVRRSAVLAILALLLVLPPVLADTVRADADQVTAGSQIEIDLGSVAPGTVVERDVTFTLVCGGLKHVDPGQTVTLSQGTTVVPAAGGSITATDATIGPVPADWTSDAAGSVSCPSATTVDSTVPSHVSLTAPSTPGLDFQFSIVFTKALAPAGAFDSTSTSGTTGVTFIVDVAEPGAPDTTPPTLVGMPSNIDAWTSDPTGTTVTYSSPTATDDRDPSPVVGCSPPSASFFVLGTTTVTCTATDASTNSASATFDVTIHLSPDTTNPALEGVPADLDLTTSDPTGLVVDYVEPTATDDRDPNPTVACVPASGATFAVGTTTVTCTATDATGNTASAAFSVAVHLATASWAEPIGASGTASVKIGKTLRLKAQALVDGVATGTSGMFVIRACGSTAVEIQAVAALQGGRWTATLDTSGLAAGCHTASLVVDGFTFGSIEITAEPAGKTKRA